MIARIDRNAYLPSDDPLCDWHCDIQMSNGQWMIIQFASKGINQEQASDIVKRIVSALP